MKKLYTTFLLTISAAIVAQTNPDLPQAYVNSCEPTVTISKTVCSSGCDYNNSELQQAIDDAVYGTEIILQAGATYTGNFTLPAKLSSGTGWIVIRSSQQAQLPMEDHRVSPADEMYMPKIQTNNTSAVFTADVKAHHYRLQGLNITITSGTLGDANQGGNTHSGFIRLGDFYESNVNNQAHDIIIDRCYIHGEPTANNRRGIWIDAYNTAVVNSYLSDFHDVGADAQAILIANCKGPVKIVNNYLEASGENVMAGGLDIPTTNMVPSDFEIRGNHFIHPLSWKQGHASYAGYPWVIKNLFELKFGRRVLIEGNIFENNWEAAQSGMAINLKSSNQDGNMPWSVTEHVTIKNNIIRHCNNGITLNECDCYIHPAPAMNNILIENNLFDDIDVNTWGTSGNGFFALVLGAVDKITINHNTILQTGNTISVDGNGTPNFVFTNNIIPLALYGIKGSGAGSGNSTISSFFPGSTFSKNVFPDQYAGSGYPANNFYPLALTDVGFVNYNNGNGGDYHLTANSAYKNAGTDGKDCGADIDIVNTATAGAINGFYQDCTTPTTIYNVNINQSLQAYPNPFNTTCIITANQKISNLVMYDVMGRNVNVTVKYFGNTAQVDRNGLNSGIYFVSIQTADKITTTKRLIIE